MRGVYVNTLAVLLGSVGGLLFIKPLQRYRSVISDSVGVLVLALGIYGIKDMNNASIVLISLLMGGVIGTALDIEGRIGHLTDRLQKRFQGQKLTEGFVSATTLFVVGPMTIIGSINAGLLNDYSVLFLKSVMDGFSAAALTATYGIGVLLSSLSVLIVQGAIALFSAHLAFLKLPMYLNDFSAVGNLMVAMIGIRMLGFKEIKVGNYLPSLLVQIFLTWLTNTLL
ncbi:DUF554 domain-containing protein [Coprothermobacter platensis]|uniref:DUF554 domain-containing protein n=1 Tax=Coprothermobacter platensis TaxID=108819 RepID=UPI0003628BEA|nr:DUF554 domain-containing protein [Coprothermobacter platensis]